MTTNTAMTAKAKKIAAQREAYKELFQMAKEQRTERLRIAEGKPSGKQVCDIGLDTIYWMGVKYQNPRLSHDNRTREDFFNEFLCEMVDRGHFGMGGAPVKNASEIEKESRVIQLALTAGANPNGWYHRFDTPIFDAFIEKNNMWWPQMSDLQGWGSQAIFSYGVNVYPYNIIFDKNGRILRKGIKLSELQGYLGGIAK